MSKIPLAKLQLWLWSDSNRFAVINSLGVVPIWVLWSEWIVEWKASVSVSIKLVSSQRMNKPGIAQVGEVNVCREASNLSIQVAWKKKRKMAAIFRLVYTRRIKSNAMSAWLVEMSTWKFFNYFSSFWSLKWSFLNSMFLCFKGTIFFLLLWK